MRLRKMSNAQQQEHALLTYLKQEEGVDGQLISTDKVHVRLGATHLQFTVHFVTVPEPMLSTPPCACLLRYPGQEP